MAIIIPSKHIYNKDNDKIRDNVIDRIEVSAKEALPNNEYETPVYNSQQIVDKTAMKSISTIQRNTVGNVIAYSGMGSGFSCNIASIEVFDIKTIHLSIFIKKIQKNSLVSKIYYEKDNDGNNQIKYSIYGKTNKGACSQSITWSPPSSAWAGEGEATFSNYGKISFTEDTIGEEENRIDLYATRSYTKEKEYSNSVVTSNFTPQDVSNVTSFVELEDRYLIEIDFVVSMKVAMLGGFGDTITNGGYNTTLVGTYEEYIPTEIEITIYGNTIGIDLTDKTVYIPDENGNKPFSVEGNELMQTSNYSVKYKNPISVTIGSELGSSAEFALYELYGSNLSVGQILHYSKEEAEVKETPEETGDPYIIRIKSNGVWAKATGKTITAYLSKTGNNAIDENYKKTQNLYKKGKETATILCDIYDNYDIQLEVLDYSLLDDGNVWCRLNAKSVNLINDLHGNYIYLNGIEGFVQDVDETELWLFVYFYSSKAVDYLKTYEITISAKLNLCFKIGDIVIPMVYGANGNDKPMSKYKSGSPKKFKVLGTRIFYDGAVWQELTLQEIL